MSEIFLSYDSGDRERVRPVRDGLTAHGYDVLWEQEAPEGVEWESWVRKQLAQCRCVVVLRSAMLSNKMQIVAEMAETHGKLVSVRLEPRNPWQPADALELVNWTSDPGHPAWQELLRRVEAKLKAALWVQRLIHDAETRAADWQAQHESSKARFDALNAQLAQARSALGAVEDKAAGLQAQIEEGARVRAKLEARRVDLEQRLASGEERHAEARRRLTSELRQTADRLSATQGALSSEQAETVRLRSALDTAEAARLDLKYRILDLEATITGKGEQITILESDLKARDEHIRGLEEHIKDRNTRISYLQNTIVALEVRIKELEPPIPPEQEGGFFGRLIQAARERMARIGWVKRSADPTSVG